MNEAIPLAARSRELLVMSSKQAFGKNRTKRSQLEASMAHSVHRKRACWKPLDKLYLRQAKITSIIYIADLACVQKFKNGIDNFNLCKHQSVWKEMFLNRVDFQQFLTCKERECGLTWHALGKTVSVWWKTKLGSNLKRVHKQIGLPHELIYRWRTFQLFGKSRTNRFGLG